MTIKTMMLSLFMIVNIGFIPAFETSLDARRPESYKKLKLTVSGDYHYPPYEFLDEKGIPTGWNVDIFKAVAEVMGLDFEIKLGPWEQVRKSLEMGEIDVLLGMYRSEERDRLVDFSMPHLTVHHLIFVRQGSPIKSKEDIRGKEIIVQRSDIMHDYLKANALTDHIVEVETPADALQLLASGKHDCALLGNLQGLFLVHKLKLSNISIVEPPLLSTHYCFAVTEGNADLLATLNEGLSLLNATKRYGEIYDKWFGVVDSPGIPVHVLAQYAAIILAPLLLLFVGSLIWSWSLKKKVAQKTEELQRELLERKQAEEALHESEEIFRLFMKYSPIYVFFKDEQIRSIQLSENYEKMLGMPIDEILGKTMDELFPSELARSMIEDDLRVMRTGRPIEIVEELDGRTYTTIKFPIMRNGKPTFLAGFTIDITEKKQMEEALRENERRYHALFESANDAIFLMDGEIFVECNSQALVMFGVNHRNEILGRSLMEFSAPRQSDGLSSEENAQKWLDTGLHGDTRKFNWLHKRKDGALFEAEVSLNNLALNGRKYIQAILRDISERRRAEEEKRLLVEQLHQMRKLEAIGRLAGGVAHDFNNMLGVILGYAQLLKSSLPVGNSMYNDVLEIEKAAIRSRDITRQLLAFSRKQVIAPRVVDLNSMIDEMRKALSRLIREDIELRFTLEKNLWKVRIDPSQIDQILVNLAVNARDAMPDGGVLSIETRNVHLDDFYCGEHLGMKPGQFVMLSVSDTGVGMDEHTRSHIFEPFFTTKELGKGTGLGLATLYGIVKQNDGWINVYSEPGQGTMFKIYIPRMKEDLQGEEQPEAVEIPSRAGTILVVEDDEMMRGMVTAMLKTIGYKVLSTKTPQEALSLFEKGEVHVDLLLTDVIMPGLSGKELADRVRSMLPETRVLFMSGYTSNVIAHRGVLEDGMHFIQKPFSMSELDRVISETLCD
ncbi:PAS domain S-box protein [Desulforhabdus amnigena]|uniref:histidine kinase n=1 Tax=Desulforhabdus amnigena TaxID=40218 RepID=A0A9W6FVC8_9BACT|nr:transporter substrate-binding domain-containing protein [Desulforhabdus amnigena]GLI35630.1 hypothetical protein DAMNIGENAA_30630 [Desulforhabdus amnigena]